MTRARFPLISLLPDWLQRPLVPAGLAKEIRPVLQVAWAGMLLAVAAVFALARTALHGQPISEMVTLFAMLLAGTASVAAAATVFGHEFSCHTMEGLLTQPVTRARLWRLKMGVATASQLPLVVLIAVLSVLALNGLDGALIPLVLFGVLILSAILVAPWMTLLTRSTLAGTVFTLALPMVLGLLTVLVATVWRQYVSPAGGFGHELHEDTVPLFVCAMGAHWIVGGVLGRRTFLRFEAIEGGSSVAPGLLGAWRARARSIPRITTASSADPAAEGRARPSGRRWMRTLVGKELHLQRLSFLMSGVYLATSGLMAVIRYLDPDWGSTTGVAVLQGATAFQLFLCPLLIGAQACAEERHLGTLSGHLMLPISAARQWTVKALCCLGLSGVLGFALPAAAVLMSGIAWPISNWPVLIVELSGLVILLTSIGLYSSSISNDTLCALLISLPLSMLALFGCRLSFESGPDSVSWERVFSPSGFHIDGALQQDLVMLGLCSVLALLLVGLALPHFRTVERRPGWVWRDGGILACFVVVFLSGSIILRSLTKSPEELSLSEPVTAVPISPRPRAMDPQMLRRYGLVPPSRPGAGRLDGSRILEAVQRYEANLRAQGTNVPGSVTLSTLVRNGYLDQANLRALGGLDMTLSLNVDTNRPHDVLARVQLPDGSLMILHNDGRVQTVDPARAQPPVNPE